MRAGTEAERVLLSHMLECIGRMEEYTRGGFEAYASSPLIQDAVLRNLHTLTESSQRVSEGLKATEPEIPWKQLAGFRNVVVHGYIDFDLDVAWSVAQQDLGPPREALVRLRARCAAGGNET
jgi:uncharacterized protein with HEPN domain